MYSYFAVAAAAIFGLTSASSLETRQAPDGACPTGVHVIATGGANSTDPYSYGLLVTLAQSIVNAIPGSDMVSNPYPKEDVDAAAVAQGVGSITSYVNEFHAACPDTKIALVGYSSGAIITMTGICDGNIDQSLADSTIIATVVYGDQTRVQGLSYDLGTCTDESGRLSSKRNPAGCGAFIPGIQSYCDINDPQCCNGPPEDYEIHFVYPGEYDDVATQWVVSRYNQLSGGASIDTSSSASMASATMASSVMASSAMASSNMASSTMASSMSAPMMSSSSTAPVVIATPTMTSSNVAPTMTSSPSNTTVTPPALSATASTGPAPFNSGAFSTSAPIAMVGALALGLFAFVY